MTTTIKVKKYNNQADALEMQKSIAGNYYYAGCVRDSLEKIMDSRKGNDIPYMVDVSNGDIYYVFSCDDGLQVLNKFSTTACLSGDSFKKVFLKDDSIEIEDNGSVAKTNANRKFLANLNQIVAS